MINNQRDEYVTRWCIALSIVWIIFMCNSCRGAVADVSATYEQAQTRYDSAEQSYKEKGTLNKYNPFSDPDPAATTQNPYWTLQNPTWITFLRFLGTLVVIPLVCLAGKAIGEAHFDNQTGKVAAAETVAQGQLQTKENVTESEADITAQLGKIDVNIRVLEVITDQDKRGTALINMTTAITRMREILHSQEVAASVLRNSKIRAHAKLTSDHLTDIGLASDRCNQDLIQLFELDRPV